MWKKYFTVKNVVPGRIKTPRHGIIDLSRTDLSVETLRELYEEDWPYIEITPEGREFLYGKPVQTIPEPEPAEVVTEIPPEVTDSLENVTEIPEEVTPVAPTKKSPRKRVTK